MLEYEALVAKTKLRQDFLDLGLTTLFECELTHSISALTFLVLCPLQFFKICK